MAMVKCPECGNDISDSAKMCPKCGYENKQETAEPENQKNSGMTLIYLALAILSLFMTYYFSYNLFS